MISEARPNPGNTTEVQCSICGAVLVCLSCGNHRDEHISLICGALKEMLAAYASGADKTAKESGEESLHSAVRAARAALRRYEQ